MSFLGAVSALNGVLVRPHDIRVGRDPEMAIAGGRRYRGGRPACVRATIDRVVVLGFEVRVELTNAATSTPFTAQITRGDAEALALREGDTVYVRATRVPSCRVMPKSPHRYVGDRPLTATASLRGDSGRPRRRSGPTPSQPPADARRAVPTSECVARVRIRHPVGDPAVGQEPGRDDQSGGSAVRRVGRLGQRGLRAGRERDRGRPLCRQRQLTCDRCGARVGLRPRRAHRGHQHPDSRGPVVTPRRARDAGATRAPTGRPRRAPRPARTSAPDSAIIAGMSTRAWYASASSSGTTTASPGVTAASTSRRFGEFCSQNATRASRPGRNRRMQSTTDRAVAADRGSALPCAVRTSVMRRAARIPSCSGPPSGRCAGRRPRRAWRCRVRIRSTDSLRRQGD